MANKNKGEVSLSLGSQKITLTPSYNSFAQIEDELEMCLLEVARRMPSAHLTIRQLVKVVEILSGKEDLGEAIFIEGYTGVMVKVGECLVKGIAGNPSGKVKAGEK